MLWLHGLGHFHPENEISNGFLEELDIGTSDEWILERVGIRSRRTSLSLDYIRETHNCDVRAARGAALYSNAEMAARAGAQALERAGVDASRVGLVLAGSCTPDTTTPAEACNVARELGLEVPAFDLNSACASFGAHLQHLTWMRPEALPDFVLLICVESMTRSVDYRDRTTAVLFGDAAAAALISPRVPGPARVCQARAASSPSGADKVQIPRAGYFSQDGRVLQMFAIKKTCEGIERVRELRAAEPDGDASRPLHFVGHQANLRVLEQACRRCAIPPERHRSNVAGFGNTGAASAPSVLSMEWDKWRPGDDVALVTVGAGLTWASALLRFEMAA